jgi:hypothetical protein
VRIESFVAKGVTLALFAMGLSSPALAQPGSTVNPRRFTLECESPKIPPPPFPAWVTDVNLDLRTYYVETQFGGPDEIVSDDGNRIMFRSWRFGVHGLPVGRPEAFDRADGHFYFNPRTDRATPPDAICRVSPPRKGFKADEKFIGPGPSAPGQPDAWTEMRNKWDASH